jgi:hypothetical protein
MHCMANNERAPKMNRGQAADQVLEDLPDQTIGGALAHGTELSRPLSYWLEDKALLGGRRARQADRQSGPLLRTGNRVIR